MTQGTSTTTSRRALLTTLAGVGVGVGVTAATGSPAAAATSRPVSLHGWPTLPDKPRQALVRLLEGNRRFRTGHAQHPDQSVRWARGLASAQHPFATVLGCVDSRVPVEIVTDQGAGDLFVARSAGHVLDDAVVGSLEFGVEELHIPLLVILGHESCGAVKAAVAAVDSHEEAAGSIRYLVEELTPAVRANATISDATKRLDATVRYNARSTVRRLLTSSKIIKDAVRAGELGVVAARYDLDTLTVTPA